MLFSFIQELKKIGCVVIFGSILDRVKDPSDIDIAVILDGNDYASAQKKIKNIASSLGVEDIIYTQKLLSYSPRKKHELIHVLLLGEDEIGTSHPIINSVANGMFINSTRI